MLQSYSVYGVHLQSDLQFPELRPHLSEDASTDTALVHVRRGRVPALNRSPNAEKGYYHAGPHRMLLDIPEVGRFDISEGKELIVDPAPEGEEGTLRSYVLGIGLAVILHQRGQLVLHASGVSMENRAVLFVGPKEAGKSTLTATLNAHGYPFVTDDIAPIHLGRSGEVVVHAGFAQQKLWPDAAQHLGRDLDRLPRLHSSVEKRLDRVLGRTVEGATPLQSVYVLDYGEEFHVSPLRGLQAFREIVTHTFIPTPVMREMGQAQHFERCRELLHDVSVFRLQRPRGLSFLPRVVECIEEHQDQLRGCLA